MISRAEILMGRDVEFPLDQALEANLEKLLTAVNLLRKAYGKPMFVSSGYRPGRFNKAAGGASRSAHITCEAVDFKDADGSLAKWCLANLTVLEDAGLYLENPTKTVGWLHVQIRPTKSRVFNP